MLARTLLAAAAWAGARDYEFQPVDVEVKTGNGITVTVRLVHKPAGKPVPGAVIFQMKTSGGLHPLSGRHI